MNIGIIGAGKIGGALGRVWAAQGRQVVFGSRSPARGEIQSLLASAGKNARAASVAEAIVASDVVVFAIPGGAMAETVSQHTAALQGKIIIDATNVVGAGQAASAVPLLMGRVADAAVFRAFNSLGFENIENPHYGDLRADLFFCGPDGAARATVSQLIEAVGFRPIYVGDNDLVNLVDAIGALWITLAFRRGMGRRLAFKLLSAEV